MSISVMNNEPVSVWRTIATIVVSSIAGGCVLGYRGVRRGLHRISGIRRSPPGDLPSRDPRQGRHDRPHLRRPGAPRGSRRPLRHAHDRHPDRPALEVAKPWHGPAPVAESGRPRHRPRRHHRSSRRASPSAGDCNRPMLGCSRVTSTGRRSASFLVSSSRRSPRKKKSASTLRSGRSPARARSSPIHPMGNAIDPSRQPLSPRCAAVLIITEPAGQPEAGAGKTVSRRPP